MLAGGSSGRDRRSAKCAATQKDIGFDGRIAAGIDDLAGVDSGDLGGHVGPVSSD